MRSNRAVFAAAVPLCLALLVGCGGDDSEEPDPAAATEEQRGACEAEVEVTGDAKLSLSAEAFVVTENRSGPVVYKVQDGPVALTVLGQNGDTPAVASLATKKGSFSGADGTVEADPEGGGAEVDATLQGDAGKRVDVVATFTC